MRQEWVEPRDGIVRCVEKDPFLLQGEACEGVLPKHGLAACLWARAGKNNFEFDRRRRLLALWGWTLLQLPFQPRGVEPAACKPGSLKAVDAALVCTMCGATLPLSMYIPQALRDGPPGAATLSLGVRVRSPPHLHTTTFLIPVRWSWSRH